MRRYCFAPQYRGDALAIVLIVCNLALTVLPANAFASSESCETTGSSICPWGTQRVYGGHQFQAPALANTALVNTYAGLRFGANVLRIPDVPFGKLKELDLHQAQFTESIDLAFRLHEIFGIFISFAGVAATGINTESITIRGVNYFVGAGGGIVLKLFQISSTNTLISVRAQAAFNNGRLITLAPLLDAAASQAGNTAEAILSGNLKELLTAPFTSFEIGGGFYIAQPVSPAFSLQAAFFVNVNRTTLKQFDVAANARIENRFTRTTPQAAIAIAFDANVPIGIPLAIMPEYRFSERNSKNQATGRRGWRSRNDLALGLYYSGRQDIQMGVTGLIELATDPVVGRSSTGAPTDSGAPNRFGGEAIVRYYW